MFSVARRRLTILSRRAMLAINQNPAGQQANIRYINNQQCIKWDDAAHTNCALTAPN